MYCYFCGKENKDEQNFCKYCGQKLHLSELIPESEYESVPEIKPDPDWMTETEPELDWTADVNPDPDLFEEEIETEPSQMKTEPEQPVELENVSPVESKPEQVMDAEPEPAPMAIEKPEKIEEQEKPEKKEKHEKPVKKKKQDKQDEPVKREQPAKGSGINKLLICVIVLLSLILVVLGSFLVTYFVKGTLNPLELFNSEKKEVSIDETAAGSDISAEVTEADKPDAEETDKEDTDKEGEGQETAGPDSKGDNDGKDEESSVGDDGEEDASGILEDSVWQDAYRKTLKDSIDGKINRDETVYYYYVYDIDKDDVPELIVQYDDSVAGAHGLVYTIGKTDREPTQIGDIGLGGSGLYTYPGKNGIIRNYARMDYQVVDVLSIENDTIEENNIHEQENDFNGKKEWYMDIDDIVTGALYIEPTEPTDDSAISGYRDHVKEIVSMKNKDIHRYEIFTEDITWTEAYEKCRQMGGYLARIDTEEENDHICALLNSKGVNGIAYIGGRRDPDSMEYYWVGNDGELYDYDISYGEFYKFWLDDEPSYKDEVDGKTVDECYMSMLYKKNEGKWYWNDISNDVRALAPKYYTGKISYICEYE